LNFSKISNFFWHKFFFKSFKNGKLAKVRYFCDLYFEKKLSLTQFYYIRIKTLICYVKQNLLLISKHFKWIRQAVFESVQEKNQKMVCHNNIIQYTLVRWRSADSNPTQGEKNFFVFYSKYLTLFFTFSNIVIKILRTSN